MLQRMVVDPAPADAASVELAHDRLQLAHPCIARVLVFGRNGEYRIEQLLAAGQQRAFNGRARRIRVGQRTIEQRLGCATLRVRAVKTEKRIVDKHVDRGFALTQQVLAARDIAIDFGHIGPERGISRPDDRGEMSGVLRAAERRPALLAEGLVGPSAPGVWRSMVDDVVHAGQQQLVSGGLELARGGGPVALDPDEGLGAHQRPAIEHRRGARHLQTQVRSTRPELLGFGNRVGTEGAQDVDIHAIALRARNKTTIVRPCS